MFSAKHILVCLPVEKSSSETVVLFPFSIVVSSKRRECFPLKADRFWEWRQKESDKVTSPETAPLNPKMK